ncbi:MAG: DUF3990 domain-containing protein [Bacillales bacterium]|nr:DUF3990 domain-containing protein [Bacillales bacterium]
MIVKNGISIFPRRRGGADFGPGFYWTTHFTQAKEWAKRRTEKPIPVKQVLDSQGITIRDFSGMKKNFEAVVLKFEIKNIENWAKCKHKVFKDNDDEWKHFVWNMRQANQPLPQCNYDWVYGFVADGGLQSMDYNDLCAYENKDQSCFDKKGSAMPQDVGGDKMSVTNNLKLRKEMEIMVHHIIQELIVEFGKSEKEAIHLVNKSGVEESLMKDPMGFHESPYNWALSVLTDSDDVKALEKHLYH